MSSKRVYRKYNYHEYINNWMHQVEQKKIVASNEMKQLMDLIRPILDDDNVEFRAEIVEEYVRITEKYFFKLNDDQKFYASLILGLFYKDSGMLVFSIIFIMAGRGWGKNGFISSLANFMITKHHGIKNYNVDIVANSEEQAKTSFNEVYEAIYDMGDKGKRLYNYNLTKIQDRNTRSILSYKTSNANTKDGGRQGCVIFDEIHAYKNYDTVKVFTGGLGKVEQPRRIFITTDGEVRDGLLDDYKERARRVLTGEEEFNGFLPIIMKLDTIQEVGKPELWVKANPRILKDATLKHEIETEYNEMLMNESLKEAFITKRMNIPYTSKTRTVTTWEDLMATAEHEWIDLKGLECVGSIDFADLRDFASVGLRWKKDGKTYFKQHSWVHERSLQLTKYNINIDEAVKKGWLTIVREQDHPTISPELLANWFIEKAQEGYYISTIKADSFRFGAIKETFENLGLPDVELVRSGSISHNKVAPVIDLLFADRKLVFEDDKLMRWYVWNVERVVDKKGNVSYIKIDPERRKTDGFFCFLHSLIDDKLEESTEPVFYDVVTY